MTSDVAFRPFELVNMTTADATNAILQRVVQLDCSDLYLLTNPESVEIAVRRLGRVQRLAVVPADHGRHLINHIKAEAGMDIAEQRRPLDGRWITSVGEFSLDMRVNCISTVHGVDMSMRIWNRTSGLMRLEELGMTQRDLGIVLSMLNRPSGLLIVAGPMGTGKTTTLYACLQHLNNGERKINTIEDPVEYILPGIRQSQVSEKQDLTFAVLLRSILRQSADVIMIGEIRDIETANTAIRAANTGQLVLASLHSPVAGTAVQNLAALGANPYFLSNSLLGVIAQRLIRTLCPHCRICYDMSEANDMFQEIAGMLGPNEGKAIYGPAGCDACFGTGYSGRTGLFEVMPMNHELRKLIAESRPRAELEVAAARGGMVPLRRAALLKVAHGTASTEEILRNVSAEMLGLED